MNRIDISVWDDRAGHWWWDDSEDHGGYDRISPQGPFGRETDAILDARNRFPNSLVVIDYGRPLHYLAEEMFNLDQNQKPA